MEFSTEDTTEIFYLLNTALLKQEENPSFQLINKEKAERMLQTIADTLKLKIQSKFDFNEDFDPNDQYANFVNYSERIYFRQCMFEAGVSFTHIKSISTMHINEMIHNTMHNNKLIAVKRLKDLTKCLGLKESKEIIDKFFTKFNTIIPYV